MSDAENTQDSLIPERVGDRLRAARMKAGLDLADIANRTRIPLRHLTAIEAGDYAALPSITYAIGFVKSFARAVGEDGPALASDLREEMGTQTPLERAQPVSMDEVEAGPVPSFKWAWTALIVALLVAGAYALIRNFNTSLPEMPANEAAAVADEDGEASSNSAAPAAAPNPKGSVVLTARDAVWLRIYDASNKVLFEKEMARGERFSVPADANNPMIRTGRADLLQVTVDGKEVAPLGPAERTVKDVGVSAAALAARDATAAATPSVASGASASAAADAAVPAGSASNAAGAAAAAQPN